jgi:hypothetical protein
MVTKEEANRIFDAAASKTITTALALEASGREVTPESVTAELAAAMAESAKKLDSSLVLDGKLIFFFEEELFPRVKSLLLPYLNSRNQPPNTSIQ